jgi:hypothetical protein
MEPCKCDAYPFPHRPKGGQCPGWDDRPTVRKQTIDEWLDDPRRGEAEFLREKTY